MDMMQVNDVLVKAISNFQQGEIDGIWEANRQFGGGFQTSLPFAKGDLSPSDERAVKKHGVIFRSTDDGRVFAIDPNTRDILNKYINPSGTAEKQSKEIGGRLSDTQAKERAAQAETKPVEKKPYEMTKEGHINVKGSDNTYKVFEDLLKEKKGGIINGFDFSADSVRVTKSMADKLSKENREKLLTMPVEMMSKVAAEVAAKSGM